MVSLVRNDNQEKIGNVLHVKMGPNSYYPQHLPVRLQAALLLLAVAPGLDSLQPFVIIKLRDTLVA